MDTILVYHRWLIYLENIIVHAMNFDLEFRRFSETCVLASTSSKPEVEPKKCELFRRKVSFLVMFSVRKELPHTLTK